MCKTYCRCTFWNLGYPQDPPYGPVSSCVTWLCLACCIRRIRELNENNTKKFIEERKRQAVIQSRQMELLRKLHQDQADKLRIEMNSVIAVIFFKFGVEEERGKCFPFYDTKFDTTQRDLAPWRRFFYRPNCAVAIVGTCSTYYSCNNRVRHRPILFC